MSRYSRRPSRTRRASAGSSPFRAGVIAVVADRALHLLRASSKQNPFAHPYELHALFDSANRAGQQRSPVRIAGVDVGKVMKVEPLGDGSGLAKVTMEIEDEGLPIKRGRAS